MRRAFPLAALAALFVVAIPLPALADPAVPTNYRSEVTGIEPASDSIDVQVAGGDAFLTIEAAAGATVEVPGYEGEPYVRISGDGEVQVNHNSPSHWVNIDRFGQTAVPEGATTEADPDWVVAGQGGRYGWHDHRIHWMSPDPPPSVDEGTQSVLYDWRVPVTVDGQAADVLGVLHWLPSVSPVPWLAVALAAAAAAVWWSVPVAVVVAAVLASLVGVGQAVESPLALLMESLAWAPPVTALAMAGLGLVLSRWRQRLMALSAVLLGVWAGLRLATLWMPSLPTALPAALERFAVAAALGAGIGGLVAAYRELGRPVTT